MACDLPLADRPWRWVLRAHRQNFLLEIRKFSLDLLPHDLCFFARLRRVSQRDRVRPAGRRMMEHAGNNHPVPPVLYVRWPVFRGF